VPDAGASRTALRGLSATGSDDEARTAYAQRSGRRSSSRATDGRCADRALRCRRGAGACRGRGHNGPRRWRRRDRGGCPRAPDGCPAAATSTVSLAAARRAGARLLVPGEEVWPRALDDLGARTRLSVGSGDVRALSSSATLALVGARAATAYGTHVVTELAADSARGWSWSPGGLRHRRIGAPRRVARRRQRSPCWPAEWTAPGRSR
jgi:DNA processing protein